MTIIRHGLSIGIERVDNDFFLSLKVSGKLTHKDYEKITPMIDAALEGIEEPKIKAYIDGSEFEGWELRAAWDDLKLGLKHGGEFEKIAIFGKQGCPKCDTTKNKLRHFAARWQVDHKLQLVFHDLDTVDGLAEGAFYDVNDVPVIIVEKEQSITGLAIQAV